MIAIVDWGRHLLSCREELGLSRRELASRIGVTPKTLQRWELSLGHPHPENMRQLMEQLPSLRPPDLSEASVGGEDTLLDKLERLQIESTTDPLTGLTNRRAYDETILTELNDAYRRSASVALLFLDVDHFKSINTTHGQPGGDVVLKELANVLVGMVRPRDLVARCGGEEFVVLCPNTDLQGARLLAERIRARVEAAPLGPARATVSIGCAVHQAGQANIEERSERIAQRLYAQAAEAMQAAKKTGRNRVCFHDSFSAKSPGQVEWLSDTPRLRDWLAQRFEGWRLPRGRRAAAAAALMMLLATAAGDDEASSGCMGKPDKAPLSCPAGTYKSDGECVPKGRAPDCKTNPEPGCCDYGEEHC